MAGLTNSQLLPYQSGTDLRCDAASDPVTGREGMWEQFVKRFEEQLTPLVQLRNRLVDVPAAMVEWNAPDPTVGVQLGSIASAGFGVPWTSVLFDTDNMVDLDADPYSIAPQRDGYYQVFGMLRSLERTSTSWFQGVSLNGGAGVNSPGFWISSGGFESYWGLGISDGAGTLWYASDVASSRLAPWDTSAATFLQPFTMGISGNSTIPVTYIHLAAVWHSDL